MQVGLIHYIENLLGEPIRQFDSIAGGDISSVYRIETNNQRFIVKSSADKSANEMFQAEKEGLEVIRSSNSIKVPEVIFLDRQANDCFLIMEFVESKRAEPSDYNRLGHQLAELHRVSTTAFGLQQDNFIGSLPQLNRQANRWSSFYVSQRLVPQLKLATSQKFLDQKDMPDDDRLLEVCEHLFLPIRPALLHGDLWSGNYLISSEGVPYLIDPAVYYGHSEVDLAMTKLFGGFGDTFYSAYHEALPRLSGDVERFEIYQLYYLLVHLNLFGRSYYSQVKRMLDRYF